MTYADKIRAMADEELTDFLAYISSCELCPANTAKCDGENCYEQWYDWLKEEAKE